MQVENDYSKRDLYLMSNLASVALIISPGPTAPALSEETAANNSGCGSVPVHVNSNY